MFLFGREKFVVKKAAFAGLVLVFLLSALTGCNSDSEPTLHDRLIGVWAEPQWNDEYVIGEATLSYTCSFPGGDFCMCFSGTIRRVVGLDGQAANQVVSGVIIFQYAPGDYRALYFSGYADGNELRFATAWDPEGEGEFGAVASQPNLNAANHFTTDTAINNYIGAWGGPYIRQ